MKNGNEAGEENRVFRFRHVSENLVIRPLSVVVNHRLCMQREKPFSYSNSIFFLTELSFEKNSSF